MTPCVPSKPSEQCRHCMRFKRHVPVVRGSKTPRLSIDASTLQWEGQCVMLVLPVVRARAFGGREACA